MNAEMIETTLSVITGDIDEGLFAEAIEALTWLKSELERLTDEERALLDDDLTERIALEYDRALTLLNES